MKQLVFTIWLFALLHLPAIADKFSYLTNLHQRAVSAPFLLSRGELFFVNTLIAHVNASSSNDKNLTASFWTGDRVLLVGIGSSYGSTAFIVRNTLEELYDYLPYTPKLPELTNTNFTDSCGIDLYCRWLTTIDYMHSFLLTNTVNRLGIVTAP